LKQNNIQERQIFQTDSKQSSVFLDLRGVACPLNYVRTKLQLEKMQTGEILEILLDDGEAIESLTNSVLADGVKILTKESFGAFWKISLFQDMKCP
jgi:sulfite reductase (ferredoxin)